MTAPMAAPASRGRSSGVQRLLTALVGVPLILAAVFLLPGWAFFALMALFVDWAAWEYVQIVRARAPRAPLAALLLFVPLAGVGFSLVLLGDGAGLAPSPLHLFTGGLLLTVGLGSFVLLGRTPVEESIVALGALGFGVPYLALPLSSLHYLQQLDPWLIFLLLAIVWLGDSAAYYVGSAWGRHKMAPVVSPKKSWEGAAAGFAVGVISAIVWSYVRLGAVLPGMVALGAATAVAAQIGDLVESMIKRGAGVKDSGNALPGHGGLLDRIDALLFAAPVLLFAAWVIDLENLVR